MSRTNRVWMPLFVAIALVIAAISCDDSGGGGNYNQPSYNQPSYSAPSTSSDDDSSTTSDYSWWMHNEAPSSEDYNPPANNEPIYGDGDGIDSIYNEPVYEPIYGDGDGIDPIYNEPDYEPIYGDGDAIVEDYSPDYSDSEACCD